LYGSEKRNAAVVVDVLDVLVVEMLAVIAKR
jgi:hypothetical protein